MRYLSFLAVMISFVATKAVNDYRGEAKGKASQEIFISELFS